MSTVTIDQALLRAKAHQQAGELPQAEVLCRQILGTLPRQPEALCLLGVIAHQANRHDAAVELLTQALLADPRNPAPYLSLGDVNRALGRPDEALACYRHTLRLYPSCADAYYGLGLVFQGKMESVEAIASYQKALALRPKFAEARNNLGAAFASQKRWQEAIACYQRALEIKPAYVEAHYNLGVALESQGKFEEAIAHYQKAVDLQPDFVMAWKKLGTSFFSAGRLDEASICAGKSIALQPDNVVPHNIITNVFNDQGNWAESVATYREAIRLSPKEPALLSNLLLALHLQPGYDAQALLQEHRQWEQWHGETRRRFHRPHVNKTDPERRLKIGYISPDLGNKPIGRFLLPLLENHNHSDFQILCYADGSPRDALATRLQACADEWRETACFTEERLTDLIHEDGVDILVDLALHSGSNRLPVFARKPAPVQVTWLAYPSTSGLDTMDYRLTDPYLDPPGGDDANYSETSLRLPDTYWCYPPPEEAPAITPLPARSAGVVTFGCFNGFRKVNPTVLAVWARLLRATTGSRLLVYANEGRFREQALARLAAEGIAPQRVDFVDNAPLPEYFGNHGRTDIALDPFPCGGGTTTCDALWMGVPVVTLAGRTAVGRGGVSILSNIGLPELIARSEDEYVRIAAGLASDLPQLAELRATLRERMLASPLMDGPRFARGIEAAYRQMWTNWCNDRERNQ